MNLNTDSKLAKCGLVFNLPRLPVWNCRKSPFLTIFKLDEHL